MSWTSNGFFRNANILKQLDASTADSIVEIYQPGTLNLSSMAEDARYSGFITSLRLSVAITSIPEMQFPETEIGMGEGEINALLRAKEIVSPKIQLNLLLKSSNITAPLKIGAVSLFNRAPYYTVDLLLYLTDAAAFDLASDCVLLMQLENVGYGLLEGIDRVAVFGSAVEEAENTAPSLNITVLGGGGGETTPQNAITNNQGELIVSNSGDVITT